MTVRVLVRRAAKLDLVAIEDWYDAQQAGLGAEFREAVDEVIARIGSNPLNPHHERRRVGRLAQTDNYGFSRKFGWVNDRIGVSWQLNLQ